jgi:hypothetical protein
MLPTPLPLLLLLLLLLLSGLLLIVSIFSFCTGGDKIITAANKTPLLSQRRK